MKRHELAVAVSAVKAETKNALQTMYNALNQGQKKKITSDASVRALFERYGVEHIE